MNKKDMIKTFDYSEFIDEIIDELDEGSIKANDDLQILREKDGRIIDWYYSDMKMREYLEELNSDERKRFLGDLADLERITTMDLLEEMTRKSSINLSIGREYLRDRLLVDIRRKGPDAKGDFFVLKHKKLILDYYGEKYKGKATKLEEMSLKKALVWATRDETEQLPFESMILGINREIMGLTVREAGERFGFPFQAINRWEKKIVPNNENQEKLASAMGFPRTEFFKAYWGLADEQPKIGKHVFNRKHTFFEFFDREATPVEHDVAFTLDPNTNLLGLPIVQPMVSTTESTALAKVYIDLTREEIKKKS